MKHGGSLWENLILFFFVLFFFKLKKKEETEQQFREFVFDSEWKEKAEVM